MCNDRPRTDHQYTAAESEPPVTQQYPSPDNQPHGDQQGAAQPGYPPPAYPQQGYPQPGYQQQGYNPYAGRQKSRLAAGLLGIFVGGLGVHRFYLGYTGIGIAQIAVTIVTFGVGAIWGFIEGILYLTSKTGTYSVDANGIPLEG